jgi:hypothetical protein
VNAGWKLILPQKLHYLLHYNFKLGIVAVPGGMAGVFKNVLGIL